MNCIVDDIDQVIASMRQVNEITSYFDPTIKDLIPFSDAGHRLAVANKLLEKDRDSVFKYQKYPLIALFMDVPEQVVDGMIHYSLVVGIFNLTDANYTVQQRYEKNFKPILYPLYKQFLTNLRTVGCFAWQGDQTFPPHTKLDRPFWGKVYDQGNEGYIFNDRLDCIEITDLKINKRIKEC